MRGFLTFFCLTLAARPAGGAASGSGASSAAGESSAAGPGAAGLGGGFAGGGGGGAGASFGTVAGVKGKTILLTGTSGNTASPQIAARRPRPVTDAAERPGQ